MGSRRRPPLQEAGLTPGRGHRFSSTPTARGPGCGRTAPLAGPTRGRQGSGHSSCFRGMGLADPFQAMWSAGSAGGRRSRGGLSPAGRRSLVSRLSAGRAGRCRSPSFVPPGGMEMAGATSARQARPRTAGRDGLPPRGESRRRGRALHVSGHAARGGSFGAPNRVSLDAFAWRTASGKVNLDQPCSKTQPESRTQKVRLKSPRSLALGLRAHHPRRPSRVHHPRTCRESLRFAADYPAAT